MGHRPLEFSKVKSSMISEIAYDKAAGTLHVKFPKGKHYAYSDVAPSLYESLKGAESIGSFFAQNVRGKFPHRMIHEGAAK